MRKDFEASCVYRQYYKACSRSKKFSVVLIKHGFRVSIPELSMDEFPLVFTVKSLSNRQDDVTDYDDIDMTNNYKIWDTPIRAYGKNFYRPFRRKWGDVEGAIVKEFAGVQSKINVEYNYPPRLNHDYSVASEPFMYDSVKDFLLTHKKAVVSSDSMDADVQKIRKRVKDYVIYRGEYWERCEEPRYMYVKADGLANFTVDYIDKPKRELNRFYFSANERKHALNVVRNDVDAPLSRVPCNTKDNIIVHMPLHVTPVKK